VGRGGGAGAAGLVSSSSWTWSLHRPYLVPTWSLFKAPMTESGLNRDNDAKVTSGLGKHLGPTWH
jgi:hypothetical protein